MIKHIPNVITLLNLFSGCVAVIFAVEGHLIYAAFFAFLGIVFDFFDGLAARLLNVQSDLGLQLDSLADMVTSGLVPGLVMMQLLKQSLEKTQWVAVEGSFYSSEFLPYLGLLITLASAYRLAKFNLDTRQSSSFIGLPTPANSLFILSLPLILAYQDIELVSSIILNQWVLLAITGLSCLMLNAEIPLFSLKFKSWNLKTNGFKYGFLISSIFLLVSLKFAAIPLIILLYVLFSVVFKKALEL